MSLEDDAKVLREWFFSSGAEAIQDEIANYVRLGRRFSALSLEQVKAIYIKSFGQWSEGNTGLALPQDMNDAQYEMTIRGSPVPTEEVKEAYDRLRARTIELLERAQNDPEMRNALFEAAIKKRGNPN